MSNATPEPRSLPMDRRTVLALGAWAAPAVMIAAAAPAASASAVDPTLDFSESFLDYDVLLGTAVGVSGRFAVTFSSGAGTVEGVTLQVLFFNADEAFTSAESVQVASDSIGWSFVSFGAGSGSVAYTFTWVGEIAPTESTIDLEFSVAATGAVDTSAPRGWGAIASTDGAPDLQAEGAIDATLPPPQLPVSRLTITSYDLTDAGSGAGPINWGGAQFFYNSGNGVPARGTFTYTAVLTGPGGGQIGAPLTGELTIDWGGSENIDPDTWGTAPMPPGLYTVTVTASGAGQTNIATSTLNLPG